MNLKVHIDTLVLEGVPFADRETVARAVEVELARRVQAGAIRPDPASLQEHVGGALASVLGDPRGGKR